MKLSTFVLHSSILSRANGDPSAPDSAVHGSVIFAIADRIWVFKGQSFQSYPRKKELARKNNSLLSAPLLEGSKSRRVLDRGINIIAHCCKGQTVNYIMILPRIAQLVGCRTERYYRLLYSPGCKNHVTLHACLCLDVFISYTCIVLFFFLRRTVVDAEISGAGMETIFGNTKKNGKPHETAVAGVWNGINFRGGNW